MSASSTVDRHRGGDEVRRTDEWRATVGVALGEARPSPTRRMGSGVQARAVCEMVRKIASPVGVLPVGRAGSHEVSPFDVAAALDPDVVFDARMFAGSPDLSSEDRLEVLGPRCGFAVELDAEPRRHG